MSYKKTTLVNIRSRDAYIPINNSILSDYFIDLYSRKRKFLAKLC